MRSDFCIFILTHGRADRVITFETLRRAGCTAPVFLVIDDEDEQAEEYRERFGDRVVMFSKEEMASVVDEGDNFMDRRTILYARNASYGIARELGFQYFVQLDDDYSDFLYRRFGKKTPDSLPSYHGWGVKGIDGVFEALVGFLEGTRAKTVAMSQGGDHMGGVEGNIDIRLKRKAMNSFVCDVDRPIDFVGRMNEDVNTYVVGSRRGDLFFTYMPVQLNQLATQSNEGGITELYREAGTYVKSFYTVMYAPSCTTIVPMGRKNIRLHHRIEWNAAAPKIVSPKLRKRDRKRAQRARAKK